MPMTVAPEAREFMTKQIATGGLGPYESIGLRKDGTRFPMEIRARQMEYEGRKVRVGAILDITERKQAEDELKASQQQFRALAERIQQIREEERVLIAREIHDELGGGLSGLKIDLSWLSNRIHEAKTDEERTDLVNKIHISNELINRLIMTVRHVATDLRPSVLDDLGLIAALEWQLGEFTKHTEIQHEFVTAFEYINLEEDTTVAVFRIFQETLTNVARHSEATRITVLLREEDGNLFLEVNDNGRGITEGEIQGTRSLGLLGMRERALVFGGELSLSGGSDSGTTVILKIPQDKKTLPQA